jgi:hypothetical protein
MSYPPSQLVRAYTKTILLGESYQGKDAVTSGTHQLSTKLSARIGAPTQ